MALKASDRNEIQARGGTSGWLHLYRYRVLYLCLSALAFGILVAQAFPVYFHWDDVYYLEWSQSQGNPLAVFLRSESTMYGAWRGVATSRGFRLRRSASVGQRELRTHPRAPAVGLAFQRQQSGRSERFLFHG